MSPDEIRRRHAEIVERHGPWTAHSIHLGHGIHTFADGPTADGRRLRRVLQSVVDLAGKPIEQLRVLDLACLEGLFGIEFALQGAEVVAIEGREANLAKARFAAEALALRNITFHLEDVRKLERARHGEFDVVLCLGILYHLEANDVFGLAEKIASVCRGLTVVSTHYSDGVTESREWKGRTYRGRRSREHAAGLTPAQRLDSLWYSLDNEFSFLLTRPSLYNLLRHSGFTSVLEGINPFHELWQRYVTLVAVKGLPQSLRSSPAMAAAPEEDWPEEDQQQVVKLPTDFRTAG